MRSLGISSLTNDYLYYVNQQKKTADPNSSVDFHSIYSVKKTEVSEAMKVNGYSEYLKSKFGGSIIAQNVGKDQRSIDSLGAGTFGTGNVVIAPNILEEMAKNPDKASYYERKIQNFYNSVPTYQAQLSAMGHEVHSCGIVVHPDGTVTHYISGDLKPEERAKIEAKYKAEQEAKAKRRREYMERSQKAAEERRQLSERNLRGQIRDETLSKQILASDMKIETKASNIISSAVSAYENTVTSFSENMNKNHTETIW